jgi:hypothetical protein
MRNGITVNGIRGIMRVTKIFRTLLCVGAVLAASRASGQLQFKKVNLTNLFVGEGVTIGDFNKDGKLDVAAGADLWLGPDFTQKQKYGDGAETFDGSNGYAAYYMNLPAMDVNNDGWMDIPVSAGVGGQDFWLENPKGGTGTWKKTQIAAYAGFESNCLYPLLKNGSLQLLYATNDKKIGYGTPDPSDPYKAWIFHAIGNPAPAGGFYALNTHGLGMGDINGDGRNDVVTCDAWYEQPASLAGDPLWIRHDYDFSQKKGIAASYTTNQAWGGSHMYVNDIDGDGDSDVVASLDGHGWGLAWFEQIKAPGGGITFTPHQLMGDRSQEATFGVAFSQLHSLVFMDMNGDGLKDIVTGKRYWAHNTTGDPEPMGAAVLYAFLQQRGAGGTTFKPVLIDSSSGSGCRLETADFNGDGYQDIAVSSKKGANVFLSEGRAPITTLRYPTRSSRNGEARSDAWRLWTGFTGGIPGADVYGEEGRAFNLLGSSRRGQAASTGGVYILRSASLMPVGK